jgi:hypothetical protein
MADANERRQGENSLEAYAHHVKASTLEELRVMTAAEQRQLDDQVATLYNRAHESSIAFLERSEWLKHADEAVAAMEGAINNVTREVNTLARITSTTTQTQASSEGAAS